MTWHHVPQFELRWRRIIRNFTIRNRDSRRLVFLNFLLWVKELVNSDCRFGFLVKNCIYSQLDMSRIPKFGQKMHLKQICFFFIIWLIFLYFLTKFWDSRHVQLAKYTVFDEESESEVEKSWNLESGGKTHEKLT